MCSLAFLRFFLCFSFFSCSLFLLLLLFFSLFLVLLPFFSVYFIFFYPYTFPLPVFYICFAFFFLVGYFYSYNYLSSFPFSLLFLFIFLLVLGSRCPWRHTPGPLLMQKIKPIMFQLLLAAYILALYFNTLVLKGFGFKLALNLTGTFPLRTSWNFFLRPAGGRLGPLAESGSVLLVGECHEVHRQHTG